MSEWAKPKVQSDVNEAITRIPFIRKQTIREHDTQTGFFCSRDLDFDLMTVICVIIIIHLFRIAVTKATEYTSQEKIRIHKC